MSAAAAAATEGHRHCNDVVYALNVSPDGGHRLTMKLFTCVCQRLHPRNSSRKGVAENAAKRGSGKRENVKNVGRENAGL